VRLNLFNCLGAFFCNSVTPKVGSGREAEDEVARLRGEGLEDV
jgi:hypothetical protein